MTILHTAIMGLEKINKDNFYEQRITTGLIRLDEGHDRPVWEHLSKKTKLIPFSPETIFLDGIILLAITELGVDLNDLVKGKNEALHDQDHFIDLNLDSTPSAIYEKLANILKDHKLNVFALENKGGQLSEELSRLGIKHEIFVKIS